MYQLYCKQNSLQKQSVVERNGRCAILRGMLGTNSVGPTTGNGFDPRKHFPSKQGLISRGGSWLSVNHHIEAF